MANHGYYKCNCGTEYVSDFPFRKVWCIECGEEMSVTEVTENEADALKKKLTTNISICRREK